MHSLRPIYWNRKRSKQKSKLNMKQKSKPKLNMKRKWKQWSKLEVKRSGGKSYRLKRIRIGIESAVEDNIGKKLEDKEIPG